MARKSSRKPGKKEQGKDKKYRLEFSMSSIFLWAFCGIFLLGWIFVLGILVGRGFLPGGAKSISELPGKFAQLPEVISMEQPSDADILKGIGKDPEFAFYEKLSVKKEAAARQNHSPASAKRSSKRHDPPDQKTQPPQDDSRRQYTLQLASLEKEQKAAGLVERLSAHGHPAYLSKAEVKGKNYFRVRCGRFTSEREAGEYNKRLTDQEGLHGFVLKVE